MHIASERMKIVRRISYNITMVNTLIVYTKLNIGFEMMYDIKHTLRNCTIYPALTGEKTNN